MKDLPVSPDSHASGESTGGGGDWGTGGTGQATTPAWSALPAGLRMPGVYPAGPEGVDFGLDDGVLALWSALREVRDPEMPVSLVDLGLIHDIRLEGGEAVVVMTFTATGCPCMSFMEVDVEERLLAEPQVDAVRIEVVWDPPWRRDRITAAARATMKRFGVAV